MKRVSEVRTELGAALTPRKLGVVSPSVLALCRIKRQPEGIGAGSLGQVGQSLFEDRPRASQWRQSLLPFRCPAGMSKRNKFRSPCVRETILETRKGVPTNWAGTPDRPYLERPRPFAKPFSPEIPAKKASKTSLQCPPPTAKSEDGSTLTPGPMVEEIATRLI
jgi:hypothetical protein